MDRTWIEGEGGQRSSRSRMSRVLADVTRWSAVLGGKKVRGLGGRDREGGHNAQASQQQLESSLKECNKTLLLSNN